MQGCLKGWSMKQRKHISEAVIRRLPKYLRHLNVLKKSGIERVSSQKLGDRMGITASQIRQDFSCFGEFGQQGYGYEVEGLLTEFKGILGLTQVYNVIVMGAGKLGQALTNYSNFDKRGFHICALFDVDESIVGNEIFGIHVHHVDELSEFSLKNKIDIAIISTPSHAAPSIAQLLTENGIKNIWNFAPIDIDIEGAIIENVNLSDSLYVLAYRMKETDK